MFSNYNHLVFSTNPYMIYVLNLLKACIKYFIICYPNLTCKYYNVLKTIILTNLLVIFNSKLPTIGIWLNKFVKNCELPLTKLAFIIVIEHNKQCIYIC